MTIVARFSALFWIWGPVLVFEGDSLSVGWPLDPALSFPALTRQALADLAPTVVVSAVNASRLADVQARARAVDRRLARGQPNVLHLWIGSNDVRDGVDPAAWVAALKAYCQARRRAGWRVILMTILPRGNDATPDFLTRSAAINDRLRADPSFYDRLLDVRADPVLGPDAAVRDSTLYVDQIHPAVRGHALLAPYVIRALRDLLGR